MNVNIIGYVEILDEQVKALEGATEDVTLVVNSPGGSVFDALNVVNAIQKCQHRVTAKVEVMACSAAALIALACDAVEIEKSGIMMLHNASTLTWGTKEAHQETIDALAAVDAALHTIIGRHATDETLGGRMDAGDVWLTGEDAAEMFDHVQVAEVQRTYEMAACSPLADLVASARAQAKTESGQETPVEGNAYVVTEELQALLARAERLE